MERAAGKIEGLSDSPELLKRNAEVTDSELQIKVGNLKAENERLQTDYAQLLESSTVVTNKLRQELAEVRSQLEKEGATREEVEAELSDLKQKSASAQRGDDSVQNQSPVFLTTASELPEAADLLNQLKGLRKKSRADLGDVEAFTG